jgi:integrase
MQREKVAAEKRTKVRALAERPGTPAEGEAAKAALERMGSGDSKVTTATEPNKRKLSEIFIQKLKPRPRPFLVWDTYQRGLALAMQPTGHKSWKCIYSMHGRPRWYSIGDASAIGLSDARKLAGRVMFKVAEGKDPCADRKAERSKGTFEELATQYVEEHAKRHNRSWKQADNLVRKHLLPKWGKLQAAAVTRSDVTAMMARIDAPIVANQTLAAASAMFAWAIREGVVTVNPCALVKRNDTKSRERVLSDSEIPKFWTAFDAAGLVQSTALKMILLTGQRPGEVIHMRREHIVDGWWELPGDPVPALDWPGTKNGNTHRVWLPAQALALLADMPETGLVFAGPRGGAIDRPDGAMRDICKKLGVERATPHDLRRTHGTTICALGKGRPAMNRIQNHVEGGIGGVYDRHEYGPENKLIMEAVATRIMALAEGGPVASNVIDPQAERT